MTIFRTIVTSIFVSLCFFEISQAATPTGWRNNATGRYPDANPPLEWSAEENVVWKTELPGRSFGSPVVVGERIFVVSDPAELICVSAADGKILWQQTNDAAAVLGEQKAERILAEWEKLNQQRNDLRRTYSELRKNKPDAKEEHNKLRTQISSVEEKIKQMRRTNPLSSSRGSGNTAATPVSDGKLVYAAFGSGIVAAFTVEGKRQWTKFVEGTTIGFGHASSPVLVDGKLIVHFHDLVALDAASGEIAWRAELPARHATAIAVRLGETPALISPAGSVIRASDGKVLASDRALQVSEGSQITKDGVLYAQGGRTGAFRLPQSADEEIEMELLWEATSSRGRRTPSPVIHDGLLYGVNTGGILEVFDTKTGDVVYRKRLEMGNVYSSATAAGNYIFLSSTRGETIVLRSGREYEEVARNKLEGFGSCPVFVGRRMYVRGHKHLFCIGQ